MPANNQIGSFTALIFFFLVDNDSTWMDTDAWAWKTDYENEEEESSKDNVSNENWIQSCLISSSPQAEILVIVHEDRFVVLSGMCFKLIL